jgi:quinol monooxygenase YgiN
VIVEYIRYQLAANSVADFLSSYEAACAQLRAAPQCLGYELAQCDEDPKAFVLRILWESAQAHMQGFRKGPHFPPFFAAIGPFVKEITEMRHYSPTPLAWTR